MVKLICAPHIPPRTWEQFLEECPDFSIALDGYVSEETKFLPARSIANINHHENVSRLATRCTSSQIKLNLSMHMDDMFRNELGQLDMNIFVNDCDEDVCLSYFLLKNAAMSKLTTSPAINRLVFLEDMLDSTSGAYPLSVDEPILRKIAWIFEPYRRARMNGMLHSRKPDIFEGIITDVELRIMGHITGSRSDEIPLDLRYKKIGGGTVWSMVEETGAYARTGMLADQIHSFVSVTGRGDGKYNYVLGKTSPFIDFDILGLFEHLNEIEGCENDKWGGSDIIGGSPRVSGSKIEPDQMEKYINDFLN